MRTANGENCGTGPVRNAGMSNACLSDPRTSRGSNAPVAGEKGRTGMKYVDWLKEGDSGIPLWKFLKLCHGYTELVGIYVVSKGTRKPGFWLTSNAFREAAENENTDVRWPEVERLLKYYADVPVWNICCELESSPSPDMRAKGHYAVAGIVARCQYKDLNRARSREIRDLLIQNANKREPGEDEE